MSDEDQIMSIEWCQIGSLELCALRLDGEQLILTSVLARAIGISDGVRRALDMTARRPCRLRRVQIKEARRACFVDAVKSDDLKRYIDHLWAQRDKVSPAAVNRLWQLRTSLQ